MFQWKAGKYVVSLLIEELEEWGMALIMALPGVVGSEIRKAAIPFKTIGKAVRIHRGGWIFHPGRVSIGNGTRLNVEFIINGGGGVDIGSNVRIGPRVLIYSQNHNFKDASSCIAEQGYTYARVVIEDDVWLCAGSMILPGVRVQKGTVVGAGSVVTKDTEPYSIVAGVPAVKIGQRSRQAGHQ